MVTLRAGCAPLLTAGRAIVAGAAALLLVTGCGSTFAATGSPTGGTTDPVVTAGTAASPSAIPTDGSVGTRSSDRADAITVPITTTAGPEDQPYVTAQISVGGGPPATVWLDTGSSGLLINSGAVGSDITTTSTPVGTEYTSGNLVGTLATGTVEIGGVATARPITFGLLNEQASTFTTPAGTVGIMGIGTANDADLSRQQILAPQLQLPAPYAQGSTLQVSAAGAGTWTLGPVAPTSGSSATALSPATGAPAGYPAFQRPVNLCWTIGSAASACGPTDLDTGSPSTILSQADYSTLAPSGRLLADPTPISLALPGGDPLWSFTSGSTYAQNTAGVGDIGSSRFNTGLAFFIGRTVAWDYPGGWLIVGSAG